MSTYINYPDNAAYPWQRCVKFEIHIFHTLNGSVLNRCQEVLGVLSCLRPGINIFLMFYYINTCMGAGSENVILHIFVYIYMQGGRGSEET